MSVRSLLAAGAVVAGAVGTAADDVRPAIGPFMLGSTVEEAKRAVPNAKWESHVAQASGRLNAISAVDVWSFDKLSFRLTLRPNDYGTRLLRFESEEGGVTREECERRAVALVAHLEGLFGELGPGPSSLGWGFGDATVGAASLSQIAVSDEFGDTYWQAETLDLDKPHYVVVSASYKPPATRCAIDISASTQLPEARPWGMKGANPGERLAAAERFKRELADRVERAFVGEFQTAEAARAAWRRDGRPILEEVAERVFPTPVPEAFAADAAAAVRAKRAAEPSASLEALVAVALNPHGDGIVVTRVEKEKLKEPPAKPPPDVSLRKVKDVTVLAIPVLVEKSVSQVKDALVQLPGRLVIDLRGNAGGIFDTIARVAEPFLQPSAVVVSVVSHEGTSDYVTPGPDGKRRKTAFVVLIDEETNAGALALAAALVDHTKAKVVGRLAARINGTVATVLPVSSEKGKSRDRLIRFPTGVLKRPNGTLLADGLKVDIATDMTGDAAVVEAAKGFR